MTDISKIRRHPNGPVVNLNGASRESLIEQHKAVVDAAETLLKALGSAFPHGRDYQTAHPIVQSGDRDVWEDNMTLVNNIRRDYEKITERLVVEGINSVLGSPGEEVRP